MPHGSRSDAQLAELAVFVHGALAAFHMLGIVYNAKRGNRFETVAHTAAAAFDIYATHKHIKQVHAYKSVA